MINPLADMVIAVIVGIGASSGFWSYVMKKDTTRSATLQLLLGLAHDRIIFLGMGYIERGWITKDEYEDFFKYLYTPYSKFGGNGLAEKIMDDVKKLPIYNKKRPEEELLEQIEEDE